MKSDTLSVGLVQHICSHDREENLGRIAEGVGQAASLGANLVLLQELHNGPYFCQTEDMNCFELAEPIPGPSTETLGQVAKRFGVVLVCSLFEKRASGLYHNTAVVIERDGAIAGIYRKMHIPDDPGFYEKYYFTPGDLGFRPIDTSVGRLGVLVCWDQWFPEAARLMALAGADILLYPTAIGWEPMDSDDEKQRQLDAWLAVQRGHAIANGIPVAACNRVSFEAAAKQETDKGIEFWGHSFIVGAMGEYLTRSQDTGPCVLVADIDRKDQERVRQTWPFLRDRRIDHYQDLCKRYLD